ncbi:MAG: HlyD family efflux transporter periplasmic adaptor subunit [Pseudomonadota bacterium]
MKNYLLKITAVLLLIAINICLSGCQRSKEQFSGYIEANLRYISSSQSGKLIDLKVQRGQQVKKGQVLFKIEQQPYLAEVNAAKAAVDQALANLNNAMTGERQPQLDEINAQIKQAEAQFDYANKELYRYQHLVKVDGTPQSQVDQLHRNAILSLQQIKNLQAKLANAELPERPQIIVALKATLTQMKANLQSAQWTLAQTTVTAPSDGQIFDHYYWVGEQVPAQQPVVSLLVPHDERVVFYVPAAVLDKLKIGESISFTAIDDNLKGSGEIRFISPQAEYTPPVLYTKSSAQKLVYRVEASLSSLQSKTQWHPGQLVTIELNNSLEQTTHEQ